MAYNRIFIDLNRLKTNYLYYRNKTGKNIIPVLKSNAYGHGLFTIAQYFEQIGVKMVAVASINEAMYLRNNHIRTQILILNPVSISDYHLCSVQHLTISISSFDQFIELQNNSRQEPLSIHLKIDTGLRRLGLSLGDLKLVTELLNESKNIRLAGIYSHLFDSVEQPELVSKQISIFQQAMSDIIPNDLLIHLVSTNSLSVDINETNAVRIGMGLYGISKNKDEEIKAVLSLYSDIIHVTEVNKGQPLGYKGEFITKDEGYIYTIPFGYADGLLKSHKYLIYVDGKPHKPIAKYMNLTQFFSKRKYGIGSEVEIIGPHQSVEKIAFKSKCSPYEIITALNSEIERKAI